VLSEDKGLVKSQIVTKQYYNKIEETREEAEFEKWCGRQENLGNGL